MNPANKGACPREIRAYIDQRLLDHDKLEHERSKALDDRFEAQEKATDLALDASIARLDQHNNLLGQMQEKDATYATKDSQTLLENQINKIIADHVQRREFAELKAQINEGQGRRTAFTAAGSIIVTLLALALGFMYSNQLTASDVREQIKGESPWAQDKTAIETRLDGLLTQIEALRIQAAAHEARDKQICKQLKISGC